VLLDPAGPSPTDGILRWLGQVTADHIPAWAPNVADLAPVVSASLLILVKLTVISSLVVVLLRQRRFNNLAMSDIEMAIDNTVTGIQVATEPNCKPHRKGAKDGCPPYDDGVAPMDVDTEKEGFVALGLPFYWVMGPSPQA